MIIFKLMLIILLAAPVIAWAGLLFVQARNLAVKQNRQERAMEREREKQRAGRYY